MRTDRIDDTGPLTLRHAGRLHHIGIGRAHARTHVLMLVRDLHVTVLNAATGTVTRKLTIDPTRDYQPRNVPTGRPRKKPRNLPTWVQSYSDVLRHHSGADDGNRTRVFSLGS